MIRSDPFLLVSILQKRLRLVGLPLSLFKCLESSLNYLCIFSLNSFKLFSTKLGLISLN